MGECKTLHNVLEEVHANVLLESLPLGDENTPLHRGVQAPNGGGKEHTSQMT